MTYNRFLTHLVTTENLNTALNDEEVIPNDYSLVTVKPFKTDGAGFVTDWLVVAERQFIPKWVGPNTEDIPYVASRLIGVMPSAGQLTKVDDPYKKRTGNEQE